MLAVLMLAVDLLNKAGHFLCGEPEINIGDTFNNDKCEDWDALKLCGLTHCGPLPCALSILLFNTLVQSRQEAALFS